MLCYGLIKTKTLACLHLKKQLGAVFAHLKSYLHSTSTSAGFVDIITVTIVEIMQKICKNRGLNCSLWTSILILEICKRKSNGMSPHFNNNRHFKRMFNKILWNNKKYKDQFKFKITFIKIKGQLSNYMLLKIKETLMIKNNNKIKELKIRSRK